MSTLLGGSWNLKWDTFGNVPCAVILVCNLETRKYGLVFHHKMIIVWLIITFPNAFRLRQVNIK